MVHFYEKQGGLAGTFLWFGAMEAEFDSPHPDTENLCNINRLDLVTKVLLLFFTIYKITNKVNGKIYIGKHQTKRLDDNYFGSGIQVRSAIKKYGRENFEKEILHIFDNEQDMNSKEIELVSEEFCDRKDNYNLCPGGNGGWTYANKLGLSVPIQNQNVDKEKLGKAVSLGLQNRKAAGFKLGNLATLRKDAFLGKTHSDEWKKNHSEFMKESAKGEKNSQFGSRWITNGLENRKIKVDIMPEGWYYGRIF